MFFKSGLFGFLCSQCVPTKLPSSFQYVCIKFPLCPNAFLICSPSSQDVPNSTTHFIPWPLPKVELSLLDLCSKIANFYLRSTVWHTPGLFNNLNQELSSMKWHFASYPKAACRLPLTARNFLLIFVLCCFWPRLMARAWTYSYIPLAPFTMYG